MTMARAQTVKSQLAQSIRDHVTKYRVISDQQSVATESGFDLQEQRATSKEISNVCQEVEKLLDELETHASLRGGVSSTSDEDQSRAHAERDQAKGEVRRLRAFAADDTTMETTSVADYSADPDVPDIFSEATFEEEAAEMTQSAQKIHSSMDTLSSILSENPQWWNSAILVRRIKTHAIRANYHARRVKAWGDHLRDHLLVNATELNRTASEGTLELDQLQKQLDHCRRRRQELEVRHANSNKAYAELQREYQRLLPEVERLREEAVNVGAQRGVYCPEANRVEAILLLEKLSASIPSLSSDAQLVAEWLSETQVVV